jgi:Heparinase II/III-like protein
MVYQGKKPNGAAMRLGWYINRLRSMEPAEIGYRLAQKRRQWASRGRHEGWARYPAVPLHPVFPGLRDRVLAADAAQRRAIRLAAERTLAGQFSALGRDWPARSPENLFPAELWRLDPVSGVLWPGPETYAFDIDFRDAGGRGDVKYVWEINRLQMLPPLAVCLLLDGDDRAAKAIATAISSWYEANPPFRGVGWATGIEVAFRAISLILTLELAGERLPTEIHSQATQILAASAFGLPRFPSKFSSANNHRVAELAGECLIARALAMPAPAAEQALADEIGRQVLPDGAPAEQSPTYGAFTAELALLAAAAKGGAGEPLPSIIADRLAAFAGYAAWIGPVTPALGDNDEGEAIRFRDAGEVDYPRAVAAAIAGFLARPGVAPPPGDFRTLVFNAPPTTAAPPRGLKTFAEGGLTAWHGDLGGRAADLIFDHGPLGYLSIAAHGHADALSLLLSLDGWPVLVDPGTYLYGSGGVWRDWFRSTPAHNTLNLGGQSQSVMTGPFNWSDRARAELVDAIPGADWRVTARHDGYRKRFGVLHERSVAREDESLAITDRLRGGPRAAEIVFQLAVDLTATTADNAVTISRGSEALLALHFPAGRITIAGGGGNPGEGGWVSPRFGLKLPAPRISWRGDVSDAGIVTRLTPLPPALLGAPPPVT